ncbi:unnamed protein product, partial [Heterosigma akashiwo]
RSGNLVYYEQAARWTSRRPGRRRHPRRPGRALHVPGGVLLARAGPLGRGEDGLGAGPGGHLAGLLPGTRLRVRQALGRPASGALPGVLPGDAGGERALLVCPGVEAGQAAGQRGHAEEDPHRRRRRHPQRPAGVHRRRPDPRGVRRHSGLRRRRPGRV